VLETLTPLVQRRREIRADSGGGGRYRGGLGQVVEVHRRGTTGWTVNANIDRVAFPAPGALGGGPGAPGGFVDLAGGERLPEKQLVRLTPEARVRLSFPGGGGYGDPHTRPVADVLDDVVNGYVGLEAARSVYGVAVRYDGPQDAAVRPPSRYTVDQQETARLRGEVLDWIDV
jgi:N-methylhydantoinase B